MGDLRLARDPPKNQGNTGGNATEQMQCIVPYDTYQGISCCLGD